MENVTKYILERRSVRTFDEKEIEKDVIDKLLAFAENIENPFHVPVSFRILNAKEHGLTSPVVVGADLYVAGKIQHIPNANAAFGYSFEHFVLYAQSLGIGTVWMGGTMNRPAFEKAMNLADGEMMPCVSPIGFAAEKMSVREKLMRNSIKADERMPFEKLFYNAEFNTPLTKDTAGAFLHPLEMVLPAPSAVNKQPWRIVIKDNAAHFYLKRSKGFGHDLPYDMQMIDIGIAMCHFDLAAKEKGLQTEFSQHDPMIANNKDTEYIGTYIIK